MPVIRVMPIRAFSAARLPGSSAAGLPPASIQTPPASVFSRPRPSLPAAGIPYSGVGAPVVGPRRPVAGRYTSPCDGTTYSLRSVSLSAQILTMKSSTGAHAGSLASPASSSVGSAGTACRRIMPPPYSPSCCATCASSCARSRRPAVVAGENASRRNTTWVPAVKASAPSERADASVVGIVVNADRRETAPEPGLEEPADHGVEGPTGLARCVTRRRRDSARLGRRHRQCPIGEAIGSALSRIVNPADAKDGLVTDRALEHAERMLGQRVRVAPCCVGDPCNRGRRRRLGSRLVRSQASAHACRRGHRSSRRSLTNQPID